ncbi:MAG TPA: peptidase domain-containing ABC transporter [Allosphingosinicella sp.]|jgi:ATP-binding cassette subfamily B protein RaxB
MRPVDLLELGGMRRTPYIAQAEAAECGLACLAMVAGRHGLSTDMAELRRRFPLSLKGATLKSLMDIAEQIGLTARPLRGEPVALAQLPLPAVLHWNMRHFVVLTKVRRGPKGLCYCIHDPASGARWVRQGELSRAFTGVILELTPSQSFQPKREKRNLGITQLWSKLDGLWSSLRTVLLLSLVLQLAALGGPFYLQLAVDTAFPAFDSDLLLMLAVGFGGLALINMATSWLRSLVLVSLGTALSYQVVVNLYRHLLRLPLPWFEKRHVGDIISRFDSTRPISDLLSRGLIAALVDGAMALVTLALMFVYSPLLASVAFTTLMLFICLRAVFLHALRMRNIDAITTAARENSSFIESVRGIAALKAFGQEENRQRIWQQRKADAVNAEIRLGRLNAGFDAAGQLILGLERVLFVYIAISMAMAGGFTVGMIFAFHAYKQQFLDAGTRLVEQAISFRLLDVHLDRIADIALSPAEAANENQAAGADFDGGLELRNVFFRYGAGEEDVLRGVSFTVRAGEMVAVTGPSGGGKTTLLKIMMGLFDPEQGQVMSGGRVLKSLGPHHWRRRIGSVSQDDQLYAGTLAENIAFFDPEIDMARVIEVARLACVDGDIGALPLGYETLVGDMGSALSGGQKQRVLLARALYPRPIILFMDEGTAHLDSACEEAVLRSLQALEITRVIVSHRSGPIEAADAIVVLREGRANLFPTQRGVRWLENESFAASVGEASAAVVQPDVAG